MYSSVRFLIEVGDKRVFTSEFMKPSAGGNSIDVPLNGVLAFDLIVESAPDSKGFNRSDWADARVLVKDGSRVWLDDIADQWNVSRDLPFSFMYGGEPSRKLLTQWNRDVHLEELDQERLRRTVILRDPLTGLEVRAVTTIYQDTPGIDWTLYLT